MSRLLNSLNEAHRERNVEVDEIDRNDLDPPPRNPRESGYFWISLVMLVLTCGLIVGGYLLLRDMFPSIPQ